MRKNPPVGGAPFYGLRYLASLVPVLLSVTLLVGYVSAQSVTPYPTPTSSGIIYAVTLTPTRTPTSPPVTLTPSPTLNSQPSSTSTPTLILEDVIITATPVPIATVPFGYTPKIKSINPTPSISTSKATSEAKLRGEKKLHNHKTASKVSLAGMTQVVLEEENGKGELEYHPIASDTQGLVDRDSLIEQYEGTILWVGAGGKALFAYNLDTGGYSSSSLDETNHIILHFYTPNSERIRATYDGTSIIYENMTELALELES